MAVNCRQCRYFHVTWDKKHPYGCKAFGFKSEKIPSIEVHSVSGKECTRFEKKNLPSGK